MSIYKKFIDSAKKQEQERRTMHETSAKLSPLCSRLSSTPMARANQYQRLIECPQDYGTSNCATSKHTVPMQTYHLAGHYGVQQRLFETGSIKQMCSPFTNRIKSSVEIKYLSSAATKPLNTSLLSNNSFHSSPHRQEQENNTKRFNYFEDVNDPVLLKWMQAMRFDTELECLTALQARTLAIDEHSAGALSVRNSQVAIQETRLESTFIIDLIDHLIDCLPINGPDSLDQFGLDFSHLWTRLTSQTATTLTAAQGTATTVSKPSDQATGNCNYQQQQQTNDYMNVPKREINSKNVRRGNNQLTIINCTPRKSAIANARTLKPLDKLAMQIRTVCLEVAQMVNEYQTISAQQQDNYNQFVAGNNHGLNESIENGQLEASLRRIKEFYGKFVEISIRAECANIVRALEYDFSNSTLNRLSSSASLQPTRPYESSCAQLPLKWALIALWQLTKDDTYICRTLTEKWQTTSTATTMPSVSSAERLAASECQQDENLRPQSRARVAKRLDYSTKCDEQEAQLGNLVADSHSLRSDYEKLYQICQNNEEYRRKEQQLSARSTPQKKGPNSVGEPSGKQNQGALSSALKVKDERPVRQISTIELLIEIIISQPNRHERVDVMNFIQSQANKLVDFHELDQSVSAAIYTSNQYKVAALRILNHLCVNDQAIKTILKCLSTPPPTGGDRGQNFENKIIKSIFECYQTAQEHIYQNETVFNPQRAARLAQSGDGCGRRKRARQLLQRTGSGCSDEFSDYGSRQTHSGRSSSQQMDFDCHNQYQHNQQLDDGDDEDDEGDDAVVKEAIRLLVQLTTPFHRSQQGHDYYTLIGRFSIDSLVKYLSNIIKSTNNRELLLLSLSALANISFITTEPMKVHGTNRIILELFRASKSRSRDVELRDQAVTIMTNAVATNLLDIVHNGGLTFLLSCLEICPIRMANYKQYHSRPFQNGQGSSSSASISDFNENADYRSLHEYTELYGDTCSINSAQSRAAASLSECKSRDRKPIILGSGDEVAGLLDDILECSCDQQQAGQTIYSISGTSNCLSRLTQAELAAMERIHQKTAIAFARMSADPVTTKMLLKYGGIKQMIDLCKYDYKRNYSDVVLIACIATLRKISEVIGRDVFRNYNALDLIELDLTSALKVYGNPQDIVTGSRELLASEV